MLNTLIIHNILWPRYIGAIFSNLHNLADISKSVSIDFIHIAETERSRLNLGPLDREIHNYPYSILFNGTFENITPMTLAIGLAKACLKSKHTCIVLPGYHLPAYWVALLISIIKRKRIGVFCDSTALDNEQIWIKSILKKIFFHSCDFFLAYGSASTDYLKAFGIPSRKIFAPCNAAALPTQQISLQELEKLRETANSAQKINRILYVGRLSQEKNISRLLIAAANASKRIQNIQIRICGSGPEEKCLRELAFTLGIPEKVVFLGSKDQSSLSDEYIKAKILALPSISEPWGLVVNEAQYFGCAALVSNRCGCAGDLISTKSGVIVDPYSVESIESGLLNLIEQINNKQILPADCREIVDRHSPEVAASVMYKAITAKE